jgi:hypothetical protein
MSRKKAYVYVGEECDHCRIVIDHLKEIGIEVVEKPADEMDDAMRHFVQTEQAGILPGIRMYSPHIAPDIWNVYPVTPKEVLTW